MTNPDIKHSMLKAEVLSFIILLNERLGDNNPWSDVAVDDLSIDDLVSARRLLHDLLYAPPPRSR